MGRLPTDRWGWKAVVPVKLNLAHLDLPSCRQCASFSVMGRFRDLQLTLHSVWHFPTLLAIACLVFAVAVLSYDPFSLKRASGDHVEARITHLSSIGNRYQGRWPGLQVSARTEEGAAGVTTALPADLKGCKVGDRIAAQQVGLRLYLKPSPCK